MEEDRNNSDRKKFLKRETTVPAGQLSLAICILLVMAILWSPAPWNKARADFFDLKGIERVIVKIRPIGHDMTYAQWSEMSSEDQWIKSAITQGELAQIVENNFVEIFQNQIEERSNIEVISRNTPELEIKNDGTDYLIEVYAKVEQFHGRWVSIFTATHEKIGTNEERVRILYPSIVQIMRSNEKIKIEITQSLLDYVEFAVSCPIVLTAKGEKTQKCHKIYSERRLKADDR